jgi:hypothetical protein
MEELRAGFRLDTECIVYRIYLVATATDKYRYFSPASMKNSTLKYGIKKIPNLFKLLKIYELRIQISTHINSKIGYAQNPPRIWLH